MMTSGYVPEKRKNAPGKISQFASGTNISSNSPIVITVVACHWSTKTELVVHAGHTRLATYTAKIFLEKFFRIVSTWNLPLRVNE